MPGLSPELIAELERYGEETLRAVLRELRARANNPPRRQRGRPKKPDTEQLLQRMARLCIAENIPVVAQGRPLARRVVDAGGVRRPDRKDMINSLRNAWPTVRDEYLTQAQLEHAAKEAGKAGGTVMEQFAALVRIFDRKTWLPLIEAHRTMVSAVDEAARSIENARRATKLLGVQK
jgi:hypothetical protein